MDEITLADLVEDGAGIDIYFHRCGDLQSAYNKLKPYTKFGGIEKYSSDRMFWLKIENIDKDINITAFL